MILTGSDVITCIMMSLMTSQLCTTKDSRYIAGNSSFWQEIKRKRTPYYYRTTDVCTLHIGHLSEIS